MTDVTNKNLINISKTLNAVHRNSSNELCQPRHSLPLARRIHSCTRYPTKLYSQRSSSMTHEICDQCETVGYCMKFGCIPLQPLKPCRSPYCECTPGTCSHPGCYDARSEPFEHPAPQEQIVDPCPGCTPGHVCRTPACGRLQLPQSHPLRNKP